MGSVIEWAFMVFVGMTTLIIGMRMIISPQAFNESIFGKEVHESALGPMNAMRMAVGGGLLSISSFLFGSLFFISIDSDTDWLVKSFAEYEMFSGILLSTAIGLSIFLATIVGAKYRGYTESVPKLPMIVLPILILACLIGSQDNGMW